MQLAPLPVLLANTPRDVEGCLQALAQRFVDTIDLRFQAHHWYSVLLGAIVTLAQPLPFAVHQATSVPLELAIKPYAQRRQSALLARLLPSSARSALLDTTVGVAVPFPTVRAGNVIHALRGILGLAVAGYRRVGASKRRRNQSKT